ncbi:hypothetical protein MPER_01726 [Moniliophthora perniciosa FA553]|nr:hypothetical protein MPER_01726 [Moniliophthora perniciosa FA553]
MNASYNTVGNHRLDWTPVRYARVGDSHEDILGPICENLAWGGGSFPIPAAVKLWADEANTTRLTLNILTSPKSYGNPLQNFGCAVADCSGTTYHVCNYNPPGNVIGQFPENVEV